MRIDEVEIIAALLGVWGVVVLVPILVAVGLVKKSCVDKIDELRRQFESEIRELRVKFAADRTTETLAEVQSEASQETTTKPTVAEPELAVVPERAQVVAPSDDAQVAPNKPSVAPQTEIDVQQPATPPASMPTSQPTATSRKPSIAPLPTLSLDEQQEPIQPQDEPQSLELDAFLQASTSDVNASLTPVAFDDATEDAKDEQVESERLATSTSVPLDAFLQATPDARAPQPPTTRASNTHTSTPIPHASTKNPVGDKTSFQDALEMLVGRKLLAWVAVLLFAVGSAFFVQVAIEKGLLNPTNRCIGLLLLGAAFLFFGRRLHKRGMRRYAETLTSAGIITFILTGYYAMRAQVAPFEVNVTEMVATVFIGFMIAGLYRSAVVGLTASLGGLVTPFLIKSGMEPSWLTIYLLAFFGSALILVNWLRRSSLALVPWLGALFVFFYQTNACPHNASTFNAMTNFLVGFFALDLLDQLGLFLTRRREGRAFDLIRVLLSPVVVTQAFWQICLALKHDDVVLGGLTTDAFIEAYGKYIALAFCVFYALLTVVAKPRLRAVTATAPTTPDAIAQLKFSQAAKNVMNLRSVFTVLTFLFFTVTVSKFMESERGELISWSALAVGALLIARYKRARLQTPAFVLTLAPGAQRERLALAYLNSERRVVGVMTFWSAIFFTFAVFAGVALISRYSFFSLEAFVEVVTPDVEVKYLDAYPFINAIAAPTVIASLILLGACLVHTRLFGGASNENGSNSFWLVFLARIYMLTGALALFFVSASEIYAFTTATASRLELDAPGLVGCAAILLVWSAIALVIYLFGVIADAPKARLAARITTGVLFAKLILLNLIKHPVLAGGSVYPLVDRPPQLPVGLPESVWTSVTNGLALPLLNAYSLPFAVVAAIMLLFGIVARYTRSESYRASTLGNEQKASAVWGVFGLMTLILISSLDCFAWFHFRPAQFGVNNFFAWRGVWTLLLAFAYVVWELGRATRSALTRWCAYALLLIDLLFVTYGEFFTGEWRVNNETITTLLNPYASFAAVFFISLVVLGARRGQIRATSSEPRELETIKGEQNLAATLGVFGLAGLVALASFETYRYFTGVVWFGSAENARLIALSILWTIGIAVFLAFGRAKSNLGAWFAGILIVLLVMKYFALDLTLLRGFRIPFFNPFTLATFVVFGALLYGSYAVGQFARLRLAEASAPGIGKRLERVNVGTELTSFIVAIALFQALVGTSVDVWRCADFFPRGDETPLAFMAQTALSVLWTVFATVLLIVGFIMNKRMLRWFAIALYGLTTFKALTVDLSYLESIYRVVAIFSLAFALMLAAYWYNQRRNVGDKNADAQ